MTYFPLLKLATKAFISAEAEKVVVAFLFS